MNKSKHTNQSYYDRKLARAGETIELLAKVTIVLLPLLVIGQIVHWIWF